MRLCLIAAIVFLFSLPAWGQSNPDNLYCPSTSGLPTWGNVDGPATLPTACYNTALANTPAPGSVVNVTTAAQLTTALASATCGQRITLQAGNTFSGNFTIPALSCASNNYLWIVSSGLSSLPTEGARYSTSYNGTTIYSPQMGPCYAGVTSQVGRPTLNCPGTPGTYTAQIVTPNTSPVLTFSAGTSGVRIIGIEMTRSTGTGFIAQLIKLGGLGLDHVIFDRVWCHGDENQDETETCFNMNAANYIASVDSYYNNTYCISVTGSCVDSHAIFGGTNTTNFITENVLKIVNNFVESAGENIIMGGGVANTTPSNQEYRLNLFFKPLQWNPSDPSYNGGIGGHNLVVKNIFELKNATLLLFEGNQMQNVWAPSGQNGEAFKIDATNQQNGPINQCPNCFVTHITIRYVSINTANVLGGPIVGVNGNGALAAGESNISEHDIVGDNLGYATCNGCPTSVAMTELQESSTVAAASHVLHDVTIQHVTMVEASGAPSLLGAIGMGGPISSPYRSYNMAFINNVYLTQTRGTFFVDGDGAVNCAYQQSGGTAMINACWLPTLSVTGNCFVNNGSIAWPSGNVTSVASFSSLFTNFNSGNNGNYSIVGGSPCKAIGTDGLDPGANLPAIANALNGLLPTNALFAANWNGIAPTGNQPVWPPTDGNGQTAVTTGYRIWDTGSSGGTKMGQVWTTAGASNISFTNTDKIINTLVPQAGMHFIYTFGDTPAFAAQGADSNCVTPSWNTRSFVPFNDSDSNQATCNATPNSTGTQNATVLANCGNGTNLQWMTFVYNIVNRYKGKGGTYECWNEPDGAGNFWSNSSLYGGLNKAPTLANQPPFVRMLAMCYIKSQIIHQIDPSGKVGTPSFHGPSASTWMHYFWHTSVNIPACTGSCSAAIGGATWPAATISPAITPGIFDVTIAHGMGSTNPAKPCYPQSDPTTAICAYNLIAAEIAADGLPTNLIDDEFGCHDGDNDCGNQDNEAAYVGISYLLRSNFTNPGIQQAYWYQWDAGGGNGLQGTESGTAMTTVAGWLNGATVNAYTLSGTIYSITGTSQSGASFQILWDMSQTCLILGSCTTLNQTTSFTNYIDLAGATHAVTGGVVPVGLKPVYLTGTVSSFPLLVSITGSGAVSSSPSGIFCPSTCTTSFTSGTVVTLTATPSAGWAFFGWTGSGCSGTGTCVVTMSAAESVTAVFSPISAPSGLTVTVGTVLTPGVVLKP